MKNWRLLFGLGLTLLVSTFDASAQAGGPASHTPGIGEVLRGMLPMFAVVFLIFYYLVVKPQQKKLKDHQNLFGALKKGDSVITSSGIVGKVSAIEKDHVFLEIAQNVRVKFEKTHIARKEGDPVTKRDEKGAATAA